MLRSKAESVAGRVLWSHAEILEALAEKFPSSSECLGWLEAESVPFVRRNDPFAALDADSGP